MGRKSKGGAGLQRRDPVLGARVRDLLATGAVAAPVTSDRVYEVLVARFREYARRAPATVRKDISKIVVEQRKAREQAKGAAGSPAEGGGGGGGDEDDSAGDSSEDGDEELGDGPVHNMLNASLYAGVKRPRSESEGEPPSAPTAVKPPSLFGHLLSSSSKSPSSASLPAAPAASAHVSLPPVASAPTTAQESRQRAIEQVSARKPPPPQQQQQQQQQQQSKKRARGASGGDAPAIGPSGFAQGVGASSPNDLQAERPTVRFSDMGGIDSCLQDVRELCEYPLTHPEIYRHLGVEPPRGILLHGPPGCGKTMLARAIAGEMDCAFFSVSAPEIVSGMSGESEEKLRKLFDAARAAAPAIVFIDEIDAITGKREESSRGMERRIVAQLLICMDSLRSDKDSSKDSSKDKQDDGADDGAVADAAGPEAANLDKNNVLVIGATNRPDALDPALRRAGRFDREIAMGIPDAAARARILRCITAGMRLAGDFDFDEIARNTPGFVGADLDALAKEAAVVAVNRVFFEITRAARGDGAGDGALSDEDAALDRRAAASEALRSLPHPLTKEQLAPVFVRMEDFWQAVKKVQPSAKREGFATVPSVTWDDIGSLASVREELSMAITEPIKHPERFKAMGLSAPAGVLLYGPPGCGKTLLAKAIANSSGSNFISIKGPELLNKFVGESERAVRQVFARARSSAPCVVFFDELDSLCPRRGSDGSNGVSERVVNQLLTEMDGLEERRNVFVVAATNRPDIIDPAMLRPGRLDKLLFVPLPLPQDRVDILRTVARKSPVAPDVDLDAIAASPRTEGFTGADLASLVKEAAVHALRRIAFGRDDATGQRAYIERGEGGALEQIEAADFEHALATVVPSVAPKDQKLYKRMSNQLSKARANITDGSGEPAARDDQDRSST